MMTFQWNRETCIINGKYNIVDVIQPYLVQYDGIYMMMTYSNIWLQQNT